MIFNRLFHEIPETRNIFVETNEYYELVWSEYSKAVSQFFDY